LHLLHTKQFAERFAQSKSKKVANTVFKSARLCLKVSLPQMRQRSGLSPTMYSIGSFLLKNLKPGLPMVIQSDMPD
jgi:hypothetical protein